MNKEQEITRDQLIAEVNAIKITDDASFANWFYLQCEIRGINTGWINKNFYFDGVTAKAQKELCQKYKTANYSDAVKQASKTWLDHCQQSYERADLDSAATQAVSSPDMDIVAQE